MFAAMQSLQEEPPCDVNVIPTKELASLAPSDNTMPPPRVINKGHLVQELLPIHAQEDPYMIQLLGC